MPDLLHLSPKGYQIWAERSSLRSSGCWAKKFKLWRCVVPSELQR